MPGLRRSGDPQSPHGLRSEWAGRVLGRPTHKPPRCVGPASRVEAPRPPRDAPSAGWPRHRPNLVQGLGPVRRAADIPNVGGPGFAEQATRGLVIGLQLTGVTGPPCVQGVYDERRSRPVRCGRDRAGLPGLRVVQEVRGFGGPLTPAGARVGSRGSHSKVVGPQSESGSCGHPRCVAEESRGWPAPTPGRTFHRALPDAPRFTARGGSSGRRPAGSHVEAERKPVLSTVVGRRR